MTHNAGEKGLGSAGVVALGFEVCEAARCVSRLDAGNRHHRVAGIVRQEHPASACIARRRSFRWRCVRPAWRTCWLLCTLCNHSAHCCTQLQQLVASAASEARGAGGARQHPPGASAEARPHASARSPRPWPACGCSLPPTFASYPRCPRLIKHIWSG